MLNVEQSFLPVMSSKAGLSITPANWEEVGVKRAVYYLDALLLKPGLELLKKIEDLSSYLGWRGEIVLNASSCKANKEGIITLISPYDGSRTRLSAEELWALICHLKPKAVILPTNFLSHVPEFWKHHNEITLPYFSLRDLEQQEAQPGLQGIHVNLSEFTRKEELDDYLKKWSHLPQYFFGSCAFADPVNLQKQKLWIESDEPANLALEGQIFNQQGLQSLLETQRAEQFEIMDPLCKCPTCEQGFTKAYLHHLYYHTPLLAYRYLIQHNVYWKLKITAMLNFSQNKTGPGS